MKTTEYLYTSTGPQRYNVNNCRRIIELNPHKNPLCMKGVHLEVTRQPLVERPASHEEPCGFTGFVKEPIFERVGALLENAPFHIPEFVTAWRVVVPTHPGGRLVEVKSTKVEA